MKPDSLMIKSDEHPPPSHPKVFLDRGMQRTDSLWGKLKIAHICPTIAFD
jgi:hypothetical protein